MFEDVVIRVDLDVKVLDNLNEAYFKFGITQKMVAGNELVGHCKNEILQERGLITVKCGL